jgi:hypothetical protein
MKRLESDGSACGSFAHEDRVNSGKEIIMEGGGGAKMDGWIQLTVINGKLRPVAGWLVRERKAKCFAQAPEP